jgi:hypothetical protein
VNVALVILSLLAAPPSAPPSDAPPTTAGEVFACDFEEAFDRDFDGWPDGWRRRYSRELPEFLPVGIVPDPAAAVPANHCLQLALDGDGAAVYSPEIGVSAQYSLLLSLRVKTAGLTHDGAWAVFSLLDQEGNVLQSHASPPLTKCPDWQSVRIGPIAAVSNKAAHAIVELHLAPLGKREDLTGRAWFDDLRIVRLPRMILAANSPTGLYTKRAGIELVCEVSGIRVTSPRMRFELSDQTGRLLAEHSTPLVATADAARSLAKEISSDGYAGHANWIPPVPDFGYYRVRASLLSADSADVLLDRTQTFGVLRPLAPPVRSDFGWSLPAGELPLAHGPLALLLGQAGIGWAKLPVWYDPRDTAKADRIAWFAEQLSIQNIELVGVLDQPPKELRDVFREPGRLPVASVFAEPALWQPAVGPVMTRLSLKVRWWQLGDDSDVSFVGYPGLEAKLTEIKRHLEQYGQQIHLGINWRWIYAPPKANPQRSAPWAYLSYGIDPPLAADELAAYLQLPAAALRTAPTSEPARRELPLTNVSNAPRRGPPISRSMAAARRASTLPLRWVQLPPLPRAEYTTDVRVQDLVMRMLATKINAAEAAFVPLPFDDEQGIMNADGSPGELLVPWRTTAMLVGGTEYLGPLPLPGGSMGHIFAQDGRAVMAVWSDRPTTERIFLGDNVEQIDVWGRGTKPAQREQDGQLLHELEIGTLPTFITGLSEGVARWQAALAFENPQLSSVAGREQLLVLKLKNTFPEGVNGELTLHAPKSWGIDPRPTRFKISEGDELRLPLSVVLMADANSGPQPVRLDFDVAGFRFSVHRTLQLGLDDVQVEMTTRLQKNGSLLVEQHLSNLSNRPLSFQCLLFAPGRRRETRQVINLGRERTTLKFELPNGEELIDQKLWLRAEEIGGSRVLNYTLTAER